MQRYFYEDELTNGQSFFLEESDNHHLQNVMRAKVGTEVLVVDAASNVYRVRVQGVHEGRLLLLVTEEVEGLDPELPIDLTLACGLSKGDKLDWIVQKGTELGASHFIPLALKRDVVRWTGKKVEKRIERLQKIAREASSQAHRRKLLEVSSLLTLDQLLELSGQYNYCLVAYEEKSRAGEQHAFKQCLQALEPGDKVLVVFGSEGGLDESEVQLLEANGFTLVGLGPRILRAETAPLYVASAISYEMELK